MHFHFHFHFHQLFFLFAIFTILLEVSRGRDLQPNAEYMPSEVNIAKTIVVAQKGLADFRKIQEAIDSVPSGNNQWIRIQIYPGIYQEKVYIPSDKQYIFLEGHTAHKTIIRWGDHVGLTESSTFMVAADNFVAKEILFHNNYNVAPSNPMTQAVAATIYGDKNAFYSCGFVGLQDTLFDVKGRHYFSNCYIEGLVDFIFGGAQSFYEECRIKINGWEVGGEDAGGYITAQNRNSTDDLGGYVFYGGVVSGKGRVLLGRAWNTHARVIYYKTKLNIDIAPEGWDSWNQDVRNLVFVDQDCTGEGSDVSQRANWTRHNLTQSDMQQYSRANFVGDDWITASPS